MKSAFYVCQHLHNKEEALLSSLCRSSECD
jgi:hypothetical protein